jgi:hypothetical protein
MKTKSIIILFVFALLYGCENTYIPTHEVLPPTLLDFVPKQGEVGTEITVIGENLQRVDSIWIGDSKATLLYRISNQKLIAKVRSGNRTGKIRISNVRGSSVSKGDFVVNYAVPYINHYPTEGTVNTEIVIEGTNLQFIDSVLVDNVSAVIIAQRPNELVFRVPFSDVEGCVTLRFAYFDGTQTQQIGEPGATFMVLKQAPKVTSCPESLTKYTPVTLIGEHLKLVDSLFVGDQPLEIKLQSDDELTFDLPTNYFAGNMSGSLTAVYYGIKRVVFAESFQVYADPNEPRYYTHKNVLLSARAGYGGTEESFFDAESGMVISSCDASSNISIIDFMLYDQAGYVQLYSPMNASNVVKNFKCEGKTIDPQDGTWKDFYTTETYFRVLNPDSAAQQAIINAYEAGTIVELNDAFFTGVAEPVSKAPRVYKSASDPGYSNTHFSLDAYPYGWVKNTTTGKSGIIKMKAIPKDAVNGRIPELQFDIIWSK